MKNLKNKRPFFFSLGSVAMLVLLGVYMNPFAMNSNISSDIASAKAYSSYEVTETTTNSFPCSEDVSDRELLKAERKVVNKRVETVVDYQDRVTITTTFLDKPRSPYDLERLVSKAVYTPDGNLTMYDFKGKPIPNPNKNVPREKLDVKLDRISQLGISPVLTTLSNDDKRAIEATGKKVTSLKDGAYAVTGGQTEVFVFPSEGAIKMKQIDSRTKLENKMTTFHKRLGEDASIKAATISKRTMQLPNGALKTERVQSIYKNQVIAHNGKVTLDRRGGTKSSNGRR